MANSNKKSGLKTSAVVAGVTLAGAAAGVAAAVLSDPKKRKYLEKKAQNTARTLRKEGKVVGSRLQKGLGQLKKNLQAKLKSI